MKKVIFLAVAIALTGCTYTTQMTSGNQYPAYKVVEIQKGKSTEQDLIRLFGQPTTKSVINEHDVKWIYSYTEGSASTQAYTMKTTSNFVLHTLDILMRDGVVLNYAESASPVNTSLQTKETL